MIQATSIPSFDRRVVVAENFLTESVFSSLRSAAMKTLERKRVNIPIHKRGAAISSRILSRSAPEILDFYSSTEILTWCSSVVGDALFPIPVTDLNSCSVLIYERAGDHIACHYDHNFYQGRHFTALLSLVNANEAGTGTSSAQPRSGADRKSQS